jgi:hypothetical protein
MVAGWASIAPITACAGSGADPELPAALDEVCAALPAALVVSALEEDVPERDGIAFEVPRASLIRAAHDLQRWLE